MQTKLTPNEKLVIREYLEHFKQSGGQVFFYPDMGLTLAIVPNFPGSEWANVGVAWQAATEKKFRKLVGADLAMTRADRTGMPVPLREADYKQFADSLMDTLAYGSFGPKPETNSFPNPFRERMLADPYPNRVSVEERERMNANFTEMRERMADVAAAWPFPVGKVPVGRGDSTMQRFFG